MYKKNHVVVMYTTAIIFTRYSKVCIYTVFVLRANQVLISPIGVLQSGCSMLYLILYA